MAEMRVFGEKGCFAAGTLILMADGTQKPIESIQVGDEVMAYDRHLQLSAKPVIRTYHHEPELLYLVKLWDGRELKVTPNHWMLSEKRLFREMKSFAVDDVLVDQSGEFVPIMEMLVVPPEELFNFTVLDLHTYVANGVLVHNKGSNKGGGQTRVAQEDPNTLRSKAVVRIVDVLSEGEIEGLVNGSKSIYLDDTPLVNADDSVNFEGVSFELNTGTPDQSYLPGFPSVEATAAVSTVINKNSPVIRTFSDSNLTAVRVTIGLNGLSYQEPSTGDLKGSSVQLMIEVRTATGAWTLAKSDTIQGKTTSPYERAYRIELPKGGAPWQVRVSRITPDNTHYNTVTSLPVTLAGLMGLIASPLPATDSGVNVNNEITWTTYTTIVDNKFSYPDTAHIGMLADTELFGGSSPSRSYLIKGIKLQVPSNYDPADRSYTGIWDGTFKVVWSDNPAWVMYDLLTNSRYGLGGSIDATQVDKWALYTIAQYCDEMVPDGFGGEEPRFTFNGVLNTREQAYTVLQSIASAFRGMVYWGTGVVSAAQDVPTDPVKLVTPANVIEGEFSYQGTSLKSRHTVAMVTWNDPDDHYRANIEVVEDADRINDYGFNQIDVTAFGCTSRGQAYRFGRWILDSEWNETELITYRCSYDQADLRPGDVIAVQDPAIAGVELSGRVVSATDNTLTMDRAVTIESGKTYTLDVHLADGTIATKTVTNDVGSVTTLTLDSDFASVPSAHAVFMLTSSTLAPRKFRVVSNREIEKNTFEITAAFHDTTKYARVEQNIILEAPSFTDIPTGAIAPASGILVEESLYKVNNQVKNRVSVSWTDSTDKRVTAYQVWHRYGNQNWTYKTTSDTSFDIEDGPDGLYDFRVYALDSLGNKSPKVELLGKQIFGKSAPPPDVENLSATRKVTGVQLTWSEVNDIDLIGYQVRIGADWDNGTIAVEKLVGTTIFLPLDDAQEYTFLVRAIDTLNQFSSNPTSIVAGVIPPSAPGDFEVTPQGDHVKFTLTPVAELGVEYEVRVGATWGIGQFLTFIQGNSHTLLYPDSGDATFWIKSKSAQGLYSNEARFFTTALDLVQNRNIVLEYDNQNDGGLGTYPGYSFNMEAGVSDSLLLKEVTSGVFAAKGEHYFAVNLGQSYRARNWMTTTLVNITGVGPTWDEWVDTWDSEATNVPWLPTEDLGDATIRKVIARKVASQDDRLYEFPLDDSTDEFINSAAADESIGVTYATAKFNNGALVTDLTKISWTVSIPTYPWSFGLNVKLSTGLIGDCVLFCITGNSDARWIKVGYDAVADKFYCEDQNGARLELDAAVADDDIVFFCIAQSETERTFFFKSQNTFEEASVTQTLDPLGTMDKLYAYKKV